MAEAAATEASETAQEMELETPNAAAEESTGQEAANGGGEGDGEGGANSKRAREEEAEEETGGEKKQKAEKSAEEERLEKLEGDKESGPVTLGPKSFGSSVEMFDYFFKFLHYWPPNLSVNKYEHMMLLELLKKGHHDPVIKIGEGAAAFQVRYHPQWKSRCFFIIRTDESVDDFSFRKCVDHILPLPENMQVKSDVNKALGGGGRGHGGRGGGGRGGGHGRGHGRGRGGRGRGGKLRN